MHACHLTCSVVDITQIFCRWYSLEQVQKPAFSVRVEDQQKIRNYMDYDVSRQTQFELDDPEGLQGATLTSAGNYDLCRSLNELTAEQNNNFFSRLLAYLQGK